MANFAQTVEKSLDSNQNTRFVCLLNLTNARIFDFFSRYPLTLETIATTIKIQPTNKASGE